MGGDIMNGKQLYNEMKEEEEIQSGLGLLVIDALVLFFVGYYYLTWAGLCIAGILIWLAYKSHRVLIIMMVVSSVFWGVCFWQLMYFVYTKLLSFLIDENYARFGAIVCGVLVGFYALHLHRLAYERIEEERSKKDNGHLPDIEQAESAYTVPSQSREDYSEYRRSNFVVRDYRAGRDRDTEGKEDR